MAVTKTEAVQQEWDYLAPVLPYNELPDFAGLGVDGWELVCVFESKLPPVGDGLPPFEGRQFVFKRPAA